MIGWHYFESNFLKKQKQKKKDGEGEMIKKILNRKGEAVLGTFFSEIVVVYM